MKLRAMEESQLNLIKQYEAEVERLKEHEMIWQNAW